MTDIAGAASQDSSELDRSTSSPWANHKSAASLSLRVTSSTVRLRRILAGVGGEPSLTKAKQPASQARQSALAKYVSSASGKPPESDRCSPPQPPSPWPWTSPRSAGAGHTRTPAPAAHHQQTTSPSSRSPREPRAPGTCRPSDSHPTRAPRLRQRILNRPDLRVVWRHDEHLIRPNNPPYPVLVLPFPPHEPAHESRHLRRLFRRSVRVPLVRNLHHLQPRTAERHITQNLLAFQPLGVAQLPV